MCIAAYNWNHRCCHSSLKLVALVCLRVACLSFDGWLVVDQQLGHSLLELFLPSSMAVCLVGADAKASKKNVLFHLVRSKAPCWVKPCGLWRESTLATACDVESCSIPHVPTSMASIRPTSFGLQETCRRFGLASGKVDTVSLQLTE